jgi:DNA gyrase subunit A
LVLGEDNKNDLLNNDLLNTANIKEDIKFVPIEQEMQKSYLDYDMSVIDSRALPEVRDGLNPVNRRII